MSQLHNGDVTWRCRQECREQLRFPRAKDRAGSEEGGLLGWRARRGREERKRRHRGPAKVGVGSEGSEWRVVEGVPAVGAFEVADSDARGDTESPGLEDRRLAQERELTENLD